MSFSSTQVQTIEKQDMQPSGRQFGLALSGGGFRATLFHLGTIRALRDSGLLRQVKVITSVSGGSILAAHLISNWNAYCHGDEADFTAASSKIVSFAQRDLRTRIMHLYPWAAGLRTLLYVMQVFPWPVMNNARRLRNELRRDSLTASGLLEGQYRILFGRATLSHLAPNPANGATHPDLHILGSNITTASLCAFSYRGFSSLIRERKQPLADRAIGNHVIEVAQAVACSSAFPGFFPPVRLRQSQLDWEKRDLIAQAQFIADAGVYDNLGVSPFIPVGGAAPIVPLELDKIIVSDATGDVDWDANEKMGRVVGSALRTVDLMLRYSRDEQERLIHELNLEGRFEFIEIGDTHSRVNFVPTDVQRQLRFIRTDFNRFSAQEIRELVHHGYLLASERFSERLAPASDIDRTYRSWAAEWPMVGLGALHGSRKKVVGMLREGRDRQWVRLRPMKWWPWWFHMIFAPLALFLAVSVTMLHRSRDLDTARRNQLTRSVQFIQGRELELLAQPAVPRLPSPSLDSPGYARFQVLEDHRVFDLRKWKDTLEVLRPSEESGSQVGKSQIGLESHSDPGVAGLHSIDPGRDCGVGVSRHMRLRKLAEAKYVNLEFRTTGLDVILKALPVHAEFGILDPKFLLLQDENKGIIEGQSTLIQQIAIDVHQVVVGESFDAHVEGTYWNAFQQPDQWWVGFLSYATVPKGSVLVIFPKQPKLKSYRLSVVSKTDVPEVGIPFDGDGFIHADPDGAFIYWEIVNPKWNHVYKVQWEW